MGHRQVKKYSWHEAHYVDEWQELKGQLWSAWAENQRLKKRIELLEKALNEVSGLYEKTIISPPPPVRLRRAAKSDTTHAGTRHAD